MVRRRSFYGSTEFCPVLSHAVPGLSDDFVQPLALGQTIVLGEGSGEFLPGETLGTFLIS